MHLARVYNGLATMEVGALCIDTHPVSSNSTRKRIILPNMTQIGCAPFSGIFTAIRNALYHWQAKHESQTERTLLSSVFSDIRIDIRQPKVSFPPILYACGFIAASGVPEIVAHLPPSVLREKLPKVETFEDTVKERTIKTVNSVASWQTNGYRRKTKRTPLLALLLPQVIYSSSFLAIQPGYGRQGVVNKGALKES